MMLTPEQIERMPTGRELDELVGNAIGVEPEIIHIATSDGGKSARASTNRRDGPWYTRHDLKLWLEQEQADGLHCECVLGEWKSYPRFSTDISEAWRVVDSIRGRDYKARRRFCESLASQLSVRATDYSTIGTIELVMFGNGVAQGLTPLSIARAALLAATREGK